MLVLARFSCFFSAGFSSETADKSLRPFGVTTLPFSEDSLVVLLADSRSFLADLSSEALGDLGEESESFFTAVSTVGEAGDASLAVGLAGPGEVADVAATTSFLPVSEVGALRGEEKVGDLTDGEVGDLGEGDAGGVLAVVEVAVFSESLPDLGDLGVDLLASRDLLLVVVLAVVGEVVDADVLLLSCVEDLSQENFLPAVAVVVAGSGGWPSLPMVLATTALPLAGSEPAVVFAPSPAFPSLPF